MRLTPELIKNLVNLLGGDSVLTGASDLAVYGVDGTTHCKGHPEVVVFPSSVDQIAEIMALSDAHEIPVTVRGAGTSLSGGPVPVAGGIVLCTTRMNRIVNIDRENFTVKVEVGVVLNNLNQALAREKLFFPPDPQSFLAATVGGCVSENAGGPYAVKYGVFKHYLLGVTAVLPSGAIVNLGGNTMKNVTGYDLPQILCGAEGTLAVIADVTLRLLPLPQAKSTVLAIFDQVMTAGKAVHAVRSSGVMPAKIELMDNWVVHRIEERIPLGIPLTAEAILLFEMDGSRENVAQETKAVIELCEQAGAVEVRAARDEAEANTFWTARRAGFSAVFSASPTVLAEDVTVPTNRIADQIAHTKKQCRDYGLTIPIIGHAGDGNLHPCILTDRNDATHCALAQKAAGELFDNALALGGAISGEHGIGLEKQKYLKKAMSPDAIGLLKGIKAAFDPNGLLNPGKIWEPS